MKKETLFVYVLMLVTATGLWSCQSDDEQEAVQPGGDRTEQVVPMVMNIVKEGFVGEAGTRASDEWPDGARVYLQFYNGSSRVDGLARYDASAGQWTVNYYGTITSGQQAKCEAYYFENAGTATLTSIPLTASTAVYADKQASYLLENKVVTVTARLSPQTGRLRFKGEAGYKFTFSGVKYYTGYDITVNTLSQQGGDISLTVGQDGYTPYVYGVMGSDKRIDVSYDEDYSFRKTFDGAMEVGHSGFIDVPTMESRNGWSLVDATRVEYTVSGVKFTMIKVKPGTFQMGKSADGADVTPVHNVTLTKAYYMGETEVTQALWEAVMGSNPSNFKGANKPVEKVSWNDCQTFITKLNSLTGGNFRLPTEAEWEFAAKGGTKSKGYTYSGSNTIGDVAWYTENSSNTTHDVKTKKANELGLYDMSGNVWEWCQDWFGSYSSSAQTDPTGASSGSNRVNRGGSWDDDATGCRAANRNYYGPANTFSRLGFRLASQ